MSIMEVTRPAIIVTSDSDNSDYDEPSYCKPRVVDVIVKPGGHSSDEGEKSSENTKVSIPEYAEVDKTAKTKNSSDRGVQPSGEMRMLEYAEVDKTTKKSQKERPFSMNEVELQSPVVVEQQRRPITYDEVKLESIKEDGSEQGYAESVGTLKVATKSRRESHDSSLTLLTPAHVNAARIAERGVAAQVGFTAGRNKKSSMASPRPKSPRPPVAARKDEKEESFWEKIGTLGRKKRIKEGK
ncbi:hypothetical protein C0J52_16874 [Blattella germanica]|nr:hypothetical protein C0J52_16874 [Blattella germanica]